MVLWWRNMWKWSKLCEWRSPTMEFNVVNRSVKSCGIFRLCDASSVLIVPLLFHRQFQQGRTSIVHSISSIKQRKTFYLTDPIETATFRYHGNSGSISSHDLVSNRIKGTISNSSLSFLDDWMHC